MTFAERYLAGNISVDALEDALDDAIYEWHDDYEAEEDLHEYLGFSQEEYQIWAMHPATLKLLLDNRKNFDNPLL